MRQLILGGAQFGDSYGKFIKVTKLPTVNIEKLLLYSIESGIKQIDLALNYVNADRNLAATQVARSFEYATKISYKKGQEDEIVNLLHSQLTLLGIKSFSTVLIHNWFELSIYDKKGALALLNNLVNLRLTSEIGISVYDIHEIENIDSDIDVIQAPLSFINRQFLGSGKAKELKSRGVVFQARSIFHQGLLLNPLRDIRERFPEIESFLQYCSTTNISFLQAALSVFDNQDLFSALLVGAKDVEQLQEIVDTPNQVSNILEITSNLDFSVGFSDPRTW